MTTGTLTQRTSVQPAIPGVVTLILRYIGLMVVDAFALWLIFSLINDGIWELAITIGLITLFVNVINLRPELKPLRWMSPAFALLALGVIYPIVYTVYVAFTNYGDGHLLTKAQVVQLLLRRTFVPETGTRYSWEAFINEAGEYALWLTDREGRSFFVIGQGELQPVSGEIPEQFQGFRRATRAERTRLLTAAGTQQFGPEDSRLSVTRDFAAVLEQRFTYDGAADSITDRQTGRVFTADDEIGFFVDRAAFEAARVENPEASASSFLMRTEGFPAGVGYRTVIGFANFERFFNSPALRGPLLSIFTWTVVFAFSSVVTTFALGLLVALLMQGKFFGRRFFRTMLIVPYAIPALISVVTWRGMFQPQFGIFNQIIPGLPNVFADGTLTRIAILIVNLWLGYPYFMLVCSGALAAIPADLYEAAQVDGANRFQAFRFITMPLLLVSIGPLLISSFTFNFNNYTLIAAFNDGNPVIADSPIPAGQTDILISYTYRIAFSGQGGADFGFASAISIIIFIIVGTVTIMQMGLTRRWEEVSRNV
ncbi:MAG: ABC transporter permease subunit [Aggregatilineales bacterium]